MKQAPRASAGGPEVNGRHAQEKDPHVVATSLKEQSRFVPASQNDTHPRTTRATHFPLAARPDFPTADYLRILPARPLPATFSRPPRSTSTHPVRVNSPCRLPVPPPQIQKFPGTTKPRSPLGDRGLLGM
ncbi:hypothetical protein HerbRD11066_55420 [Herbidospora sp. RD11066]